jgi:hypothetical protein
MSLEIIEVEINHGKVTALGSQSLPEHGRGLLTMLNSAPSDRSVAYSIGTEIDGLPVIRAQRGVITTAMVREIEGFAE